MTDLTGLHCVVLGGGGFLGAQVCPALNRAGARVAAFGRTRHYDAPLADARWISGDFADADALGAAVSDADVVVHLVSETTPSTAEADRLRDIDANVAGTVRLLDLCRTHGVRKVVFASSGGTVYGRAGTPPFSELSLPQPISAYGVSKLACEHYLRLYNELYGMRNLTLRISNPFGPYHHGQKNQGVIPIFIRRALAGETLEIWGDGSAVRDYIYGPDVGDAFVRAVLYQGRASEVNIGMGRGISLNSVIEQLEQVLDRRIDRVYRDARNFDVPASILDVERAATELGWTPQTGWQNALKATVDWIATQEATDR